MRAAQFGEPVRAFVGGRASAFCDFPLAHLRAAIVRGILERARPAPSSLYGAPRKEGLPSIKAPAPSGVVALHSGMAIEAGDLLVDHCHGSGLHAATYALMQFGSGASDNVAVCGATSTNMLRSVAAGARSRCTTRLRAEVSGVPGSGDDRDPQRR